MNDDDKEKLTEKAGWGCAIVYIVVQLAIPILLFLVLGMALLRGCARMFN